MKCYRGPNIEKPITTKGENKDISTLETQIYLIII